jgi:hypothetical protein
MSIQGVWQGVFDFLGAGRIVVEPSPAQLTSDAGLLPIRQFDQHLGLTEQFARALEDPRDPELIDHSFLEMTRARIYGILAGYEDQNDHDHLRHDPVFKLLADRSPTEPPLASQPTLSRFENVINIRSLKNLRDVFLDQFIASFDVPPRRVTLDMDAVDDPTHGDQQLALFHGYFDQYQYFPLLTTCAETDQFLMVSLRPGAVHAALGADDDLEYIVRRLRQAWPDVRILVRGDAGFGVPWMYDSCERLAVEYTFGLASNNVLKQRSDALLEQAVAAFAATQTPQRLFDGFWYQAESWPFPRWVIVKVEANAQGTNRRFVVSNRPGAPVVPEAAYDDYAQRGESENRNKEFKCDLAMDRTSDHRFLANYFRLYLHAAAMNLLIRLRRHVADPPPAPVPTVLSPQTPTEVPVEAWSGEHRRRYFRLRRQHDPLGEGQPCTWRTLLIKVAAEVLVSTRRILVRLSACWPYLPFFQHVCQQVTSSPPLTG